jgi:hypothetical protein
VVTSQEEVDEVVGRSVEESVGEAVKPQGEDELSTTWRYDIEDISSELLVLDSVEIEAFSTAYLKNGIVIKRRIYGEV